jgi:hypothetical protein
LEEKRRSKKRRSKKRRSKKRAGEERGKDMSRGKNLNITTNEILEVCREYGTGKEGFKALTAKYGMAYDTARNMVRMKGIRKLLKDEKAAAKIAEENRQAAESVNESVKEASEGIGHLTEERCPECGAHLLANARGQRWCSLIGCTYGLKEYTDKKTVCEAFGVPVSEVDKINQDHPDISDLFEASREAVEALKQDGAIPARKGDYIGTYTGRKYWPLDPKPEEVAIEDIAHALSQICRFTGHTKQFYSVADHCLNVERYLRDSCSAKVRLYALLHDAAEAYVCDIARPLKRYIPGYTEIENLNQVRIYEAFGLNSPGDFQEMLIKYADDYMLAVEAKEFMANTTEWNLMKIEYCEKPVIRPDAEQKYIEMFKALWNECMI